MHIVDTALEKRMAAGNPIKVAMVGAGYMARGISLEILTGIQGMKLVGVANRTIGSAERTYTDAGITEFVHCDTLQQVNEAIANFVKRTNPGRKHDITQIRIEGPKASARIVFPDRTWQIRLERDEKGWKVIER